MRISADGQKISPAVAKWANFEKWNSGPDAEFKCGYEEKKMVTKFWFKIIIFVFENIELRVWNQLFKTDLKKN